MMSANIKECPTDIAIIGSGEFARALAFRLITSGSRVTIGSRFPNKHRSYDKDDVMSKVKVTTIAECVRSSDVVVLAIHPEHHETLSPLSQMLAGKIIVDVSNSEKAKEKSNAERLAAIFPQAQVVKAFNTVSAYTLATYMDNRPIYVCGDDAFSRQIVMQLVGRIGCLAVDLGTLAAAARTEAVNRKLFPGWGWPTIVLMIVSIIWIIYTLCRYYKMRSNPYGWERLPTNVFNKIFGVISITLLALVYIPGSIAAFKQLANGTKHIRFHKSLDRWLKMRKQLGLYALLFGTLHTLMSLSLLSPAYFSSWYHKNSVIVPATAATDTEVDIDSRMSWKGETLVLLGFLAQFFMTLLGIASIPSIANSMNWREWQCVQSYMGLVALLFTTAHVTVKGAASWVEETWKDILPSMAFTSSLLPWFALLLRFILLIPCVHIRVAKIRRGWESNSARNSSIIVPHNDYDKSSSNVENGGQLNSGFINSSL